MAKFMQHAGATAILSLLLASTAAAQVNRFNEPKEKRQPAKQPAQAQPAKDVKWPDTPRKDVNAKVDFRNKKAPAFKVEKWLNDEPDRKGKVVLIDFWATWCPPCRKLIPELKAWHDKYEDDLVIIGISNEQPRDVENFMRAQQIGYAMAVDSKQTMSRAVGVGGIPHVLVISSDGIVRWQGFPMGEDPLTEEKLVQIIEADKAMQAKAKAQEAGDKAPDTAAEPSKPAAKPTPKSSERPARRPTEFNLPDDPAQLKAHITALEGRKTELKASIEQTKATIRDLEKQGTKGDAAAKQLAAAHQQLLEQTTAMTRVESELTAAELKHQAMTGTSR